MSDAPDPRLNAYRPDLADARLQGRVRAARFAAGAPFWVAAPAAPLRRRPADDAPLDSEMLRGEPLRLFDRADGWAWVQSEADGYVGYTPEAVLAPGVPPAPSHRVAVPRTLVFPEPDIKAPPQGALGLMAAIDAGGRNGRFLETALGYVIAEHCAPAGAPVAPAWWETARRFLEVPYLWGGKTALGLDCSGLVQLCLAAAGIACPRDTDMQETAFAPIPFDGDETALRPGDLVFWKGHVGIWAGPGRFVHANAGDMMVAEGPLDSIAKRIEAAGYGAITSARRPADG